MNELSVVDAQGKKVSTVKVSEAFIKPKTSPQVVQDVVVGARAAEFVEVTAGVAAGERVVTSGNFLIDSESRLKAALQGAGGHEHGQ